jgi:hypothetical protein
MRVTECGSKPVNLVVNCVTVTLCTNTEYPELQSFNITDLSCSCFWLRIPQVYYSGFRNPCHMQSFFVLKNNYT